MSPELLEALEAACGVEPKGYARPHMKEGTTLKDWKTMDGPEQKSVRTLRRQILALLRELPEHMTVAELRDELEEG